MSSIEGSTERVIIGDTKMIKPFDNEYNDEVHELPTLGSSLYDNNSDVPVIENELSVITETNDSKHVLKLLDGDSAKNLENSVDEVKNQISLLTHQLKMMENHKDKTEKCYKYVLYSWRIIISLLMIYVVINTSFNFKKSVCNCPVSNDRLIIPIEPTMTPSVAPTTSTVNGPTVNPSTKPTEAPTYLPTNTPSSPVTISPTSLPTDLPTILLTNSPTLSPTNTPSLSPTIFPSIYPSTSPSNTPTLSPTNLPSIAPSISTGNASYEPGFWNDSPETQRFTWTREHNICIVSGYVTHNGTGCVTKEVPMGTVPEPCWPLRTIIIDGIYQTANGTRQTVTYRMNTMGHIILRTFDITCQTDDTFSVQFVYRVPAY